VQRWIDAAQRPHSAAIQLFSSSNLSVKPFVLYFGARNRHAMRLVIEMRTEVQNGNCMTFAAGMSAERDPQRMMQLVEELDSALERDETTRAQFHNNIQP